MKSAAMAAAPMTAEQQALAALQAEMAQTRAQLAAVGTRFDQLQTMYTNLQQAHDKLRDDAGRVINEKADQIGELERSIANLNRRHGCELVDLTAMKPANFEGKRGECWRPWARKVKAYCEAKQHGFKKALDWA